MWGTNWWRYLVDGMVSMGPTPYSLEDGEVIKDGEAIQEDGDIKS